MMVEIEDVSASKTEAARLTGMQRGAERVGEILEASTATLEEEKLLQVALDKTLDILEWSAGLIYKLDPASTTFSPALNRKVPRKLLSKLPAFTPDEGLGGFVMKTLESHIIDVDTYPSYLPLGTLFREQGIRQISLVPLVHGESPLGFILGLSDREGKGHPADTLTLLGRQLGNAIANARRLTDMKASEGQLHLVVSSLSGTVYTSGPEGLIRSIDQSVSRLLGYTSRDFGRNRSLFLSLIHEEDKKIYLERVTASQSLPSTFVRVYRMRPKAKAACVWVRDSVSVMRDGAGRVKGFTGLLSDVTGEREKFTAVQSERSVLRSVQDVIPDGIAAFDHEGKCVEWNPTMERITGRGRNDSAGRSVEELAFLPDGLTPGMLAGKSRAQQITVLGLTGTVTGNERRYEVTLVPVPGNRGEDPGFLLRYTDVTVREKEIHALLESEKILLNVINAMDDVMMITDLGGRIVEVNRAFLKCTGYSRSEVVGEQFPYRWLDEKDMGRFLQWISRIREQKWLHDFDLTWITKRGSKVQMSLNTTPIRNSSGEPVAMLNIARDITERVRLIGDLEARNIQIEMINRVVTLANLSNDFSEVFRTVAREVVRVVPSEWVLLLAGAGLNPSFSMIENFGPGRLQPGDFLPLAGIPDAAGTGVPAPGIIGDLRFETRAVIPESLAGQARSAVVVPLVMNGKIVGTFVAANREPHAYAEEHEALLVPLVRQIGGIIERIRLFRQVASDSTYVRALLDALDSPVYTVDLAHTIREINRAGISFLEELVGAGETVRAGANLFSILGDSPLGNTLRQGVEAGEYSAEIPVDSGSGAKIIRVTVNSLREGGGITGYVFSHTDITSLKTTENELRDRARQLITLHEISMLIANSYDINLVLSSALPLLKTAIDADAVLVYLAGQGSADLRLERQEGFLADDVAPISVLSPDRSITGDVVRRREANYIERDVQRDGRISHPNRIFLEKHGMQAMAIIPILVKEKVLGALDILYRAEHVFPEQEKHILNLVGNQIGAAIENVELYKELTAQVERLSILFELSRSLTSLLDTGQICRTAFEHVSRVAECERCTIGLLDGQSGKLTVKLRAEADGDLNRVGPGDGTGMDGSGVTDVIRGRTTYRSPDRTAVIVPMVSEGTITGVIEVVTGGRPLDEVQIRLLESVGSLTAIALEKGKLYEETVEKSGEIEQRNRELDDYTYVVSHDLKEPLISIEGFSRILQMDYSDVIREEGREYLDSLVGATTRMKGLIDDLLLLSRVSRPSESFRSVDISGIIEEIRTDMEFLIKKRNVSLVVSPGLPAVRGNETQLGILFRNLIGNAVKFNDKLRPEISIGFRIHENNSYLFWVKDNGIGIDQEFHDKIFVIFQRLHRREEFEGSGAGLAIVKKIIETHQGNIWVESVKGTGSTFLFTLPADTQA
ncbi:MAG TPA: PAS domain S-box protein [Bacteroidota bacterium]|nr:PAS domain S-box protein [Bacteroidota bacterium]